MRRTPFHMTAAAILLACSAGCNIVGPAFYFIHGPEKVEAQYTLDPERSVVIYIDDRANVLPRRSLRLKIAEEAQRAMLDKKVVIKLIDFRSAFQATSLERSEKPMNIAEIGRAVEAEIVIYAKIEQFTVSSDGSSITPQVSMRVKVIDAMADVRLWPEEKEGASIGANSRLRTGYAPESSGDMAKLEDETAKMAGLALAQAFYKFEVQEAAGQAR